MLELWRAGSGSAMQLILVPGRADAIDPVWHNGCVSIW